MSLRAPKIVTSDETLDPSFDTFLIDASGGNIIFTLKNIDNDGETYQIKRIDNNVLQTVTIKGVNDNQTIEGVVSKSLSFLDSFTVMSFSGVWYYFA